MGQAQQPPQQQPSPQPQQQVQPPPPHMAGPLVTQVGAGGEAGRGTCSKTQAAGSSEQPAGPHGVHLHPLINKASLERLTA